MRRPLRSEYPTEYEKYISLVPGDNVIRILEDQTLTLQSVLSEVSEEKENYAYAQGKWTLKEVIGHIIDTERVVGYRMLRFARNDKSVLPGINAGEYVRNGNFNKRSLYDLAHEFGFVRGSNVALFKTFDEAALDRKGIADDKEMTVRGGIFMIAGHATHHVNSIKINYLD